MKKVIVISFVLFLTACAPVDHVNSTLKESRISTLGKSTQIVANYLRQDYAIKIVEGTQPTTNLFDQVCPTEAGFSDEDGDCKYDMILNDEEASFTVTIIGKDRYKGYVATSINGDTPEVNEIDE